MHCTCTLFHTSFALVFATCLCRKSLRNLIIHHRCMLRRTNKLYLQNNNTSSRETTANFRVQFDMSIGICSMCIKTGAYFFDSVQLDGKKSTYTRTATFPSFNKVIVVKLWTEQEHLPAVNKIVYLQHLSSREYISNTELLCTCVTRLHLPANNKTTKQKVTYISGKVQGLSKCPYIEFILTEQSKFSQQ